MPRKSRKAVPWTRADMKTLRREAGKKPAAQLARLFKRTVKAVELKAAKSGISLRVR